MTKKEMFEAIATTFVNNEEITAYCKKELAKLEKAENAKAEKAAASVEMDETILAVLAQIDIPVSASDILENFPNELAGMTIQKLAYRLRKLAEAGKVTKDSDGRRNLYKLA
jgi:DNA-binding transcriptional ArsR family regulator